MLPLKNISWKFFTCKTSYLNIHVPCSVVGKLSEKINDSDFLREVKSTCLYTMNEPIGCSWIQ